MWKQSKKNYDAKLEVDRTKMMEIMSVFHIFAPQASLS